MKPGPGLVLALLGWLVVAPALAQEAKPKYGPDAVPMVQSLEYLRTHPAPDYWTLSQYYAPQRTSSDCSAAAVAMLVNALRGLPPRADEPLVTESSLLATVGSERWTAETVEGGSGVTFAELEAYVRKALQGFGVNASRIEVFRPADGGPATLAALRRILTQNEQSDRDIILVYFDQGVLTGDWDGPHVSPIGAYDADTQRVLILDVTGGWYVPYWSTDGKLLEAMLRPAPPDQGILAGETGGLIRVSRAAADD